MLDNITSFIYDLHPHVLIFDPPKTCPSFTGVYDKTLIG